MFFATMLSTQTATFLGSEFTWVRGLQGLTGILPDEWYMDLHRVDPPLDQRQLQTAVRAAKGDAITVKRTSSCPPHLFVEGKHNAYFLSMVGSFQLMAALLQDSAVQQNVLQRRAQDSNVLSLAPFLPAPPAPPAPPAGPLLLGNVVPGPAPPPREPPAACQVAGGSAGGRFYCGCKRRTAPSCLAGAGTASSCSQERASTGWLSRFVT